MGELGDVMGELVRKRGRPVTGKAKSDFCGVRLSREQQEMLDYVAKTKGLTRTDVILEGLKAQYNLCKFQNRD
jgi:hypothetical protein